MTKGNKYYQQAALAYFVYGLIYFAGALYLSQQGLSDRGAMEDSGWVWFAVGALFVVGFPLVIMRGIRWFTLAVATFMMFRVYALIKIAFDGKEVLIPLPWGGEISRPVGALIFATVALMAMGMLLRAGLFSSNRQGSQTEKTANKHKS